MATKQAPPMVERQTAWRRSIDTKRALKALQDHVLENKPLKGTQIRAAEILLRKTMPDLRATEHTGQVDVTGNFYLHLD